ncbi:MAG: hypothetical protein U1E73_04215 [Planctomycetota bacterium]
MPSIPIVRPRAAVFALLATSVVAQVPPVPTPMIRRQGPFSVWPIGVVQDTVGRDKLLLVAPAPRTASPAEPGRRGRRPDYTTASLFPDLPQPLANDFGFSAIDTGNAIVPTTWNVLTSGGVPYGIAPDLRSDQRWLALSATVTNSSPLTNHPLLTAGQGSHILSYFFLESQEVPSSLLGSLQIEQTSAQMLMPAGAEISAFDFALGMLMANPEDDLPAFVPYDDVLYYSVTPHFASAYAAMSGGAQIPWFAADPADPFVRVHAPDAGVIYRSTWDDFAQTWSVPLVYKSLADLGLSAGENIDALTVDHSTGIVIFSTDRATSPLRNQVLLYHPDLTAGTNLPLYDVDGTKVSTKLGLTDEDDIDGLCGTDPEISNYVAGRAAGTPRPERFGVLFGLGALYNGLESPIGFSVARDAPNGAPFDLRLQISGWGPFEQPVPCNVNLSIRVESVNGANRTWGPWVQLAPIPRSPTQQTWEFPWSVATATPGVGRIQLDAFLTCSDTSQWLDPITGAIAPATQANATPIVGATWVTEFRF